MIDVWQQKIDMWIHTTDESLVSYDRSSTRSGHIVHSQSDKVYGTWSRRVSFRMKSCYSHFDSIIT